MKDYINIVAVSDTFTSHNALVSALHSGETMGLTIETIACFCPIIVIRAVHEAAAVEAFCQQVAGFYDTQVVATTKPSVDTIWESLNPEAGAWLAQTTQNALLSGSGEDSAVVHGCVIGDICNGGIDDNGGVCFEAQVLIGDLIPLSILLDRKVGITVNEG